MVGVTGSIPVVLTILSITDVSDPEFLNPGQPAPAAGTYEECNLFGARTGFTATIAVAGQQLPSTLPNFTWRLARPETGNDAAQAGDEALPTLPEAMPTTELRRIAELLIVEHGDRATDVASRRASAMTAAGDTRAARVWGDIKYLIDHLRFLRNA